MVRDRWLFGRRARSFTLQWHLTNACELHCAHCYDRSEREVLEYAAARETLEDFLRFCRGHGVRGQVCLTGGNPLLYPSFFPIYQAIARAGLPISILGNPAAREAIDRIVAIRRPVYYQVSLEGLPSHNDRIRGSGHFERTVQFLRTLRRSHIRAHVMLTLTQANIGQVIPLAQILEGLADRLTFNRLSPVGEGAQIAAAPRAEYEEFLREYLAASRSNPILGFKDNLFNILRHRSGRPLLRGCTGFGCGAAFNFVALLPDGEVHACRKFPSRIGHIRESGFDAIYRSPAARRFHRGCAACLRCPIRNACGGCLAVAYGHGLDIFSQRDPHCFMDS